MANERGFTTKDILSYHLLSASPLFHGDLITKPEKEIRVSSLEELLTRQVYSIVKSSNLCTHCFRFDVKMQTIPQSSRIFDIW